MAALFALAVMLAVVIVSDHPAKGLADVIGDSRVERYFVPTRGEVASRRSQRCTREIASAVISPSSFGRAIKKKLRRFVEAGAGPILGYGIDELLCRDVTRDGRREMVVLLKCCTANTPTPWAIFARRSGSWRPIFQVVSRKISVSDLRVSKKGDVLEKLPRYEQGDAVCCPSRYSYRVTHWNGSRFVVRSERP
jgi:hypothetical protein